MPNRPATTEMNERFIVHVGEGRSQRERLTGEEGPDREGDELDGIRHRQ